MEPARSIDDVLFVAYERPAPLTLCAAARAASVPAGGLSAHKLQRVLAYVNEHLAERVELRTLAALAGLSQSHFCRAFKRSIGMPPYRFQLEARVRRAQELLAMRDATLASVAAATGFADQAHFTRTFRQLIGRTPGRWQREQLPPPVREVGADAAATSARGNAQMPSAPSREDAKVVC